MPNKIKFVYHIFQKYNLSKSEMQDIKSKNQQVIEKLKEAGGIKEK